MSKPTDNFWHGFGWCLIWLGFFGGITLIIWGANHFSDQAFRLCIKEHGIWTEEKDGYGHYCNFPAPTKDKKE